MKFILIFSLAIPSAIGQIATASIQGTALDAKSGKPIPAALVIASRTGAPAFSKNTRSGGDGAFQIQGLATGTYSLCVQVPGDQYLDPCLWDANPSTVNLATIQNVTGISLKVTAASVLNVQIQDKQNLLTQSTKDARHPDLSIGVWGPRGLFYPAHRANGPAAAPPFFGSPATYSYRLAVPRDITLQFHITSHDLKLGDAGGAALPANASQQAFQHATGDANPKSFAFTVLGLLP